MVMIVIKKDDNGDDNDKKIKKRKCEMGLDEIMNNKQ